MNDLEDIMLIERSQTQKDKYCMFPPYVVVIRVWGVVEMGRI